MSAAAAQPVLWFRADASPQMGTGHVMRCLALAQAWQDRGGRAVFGMRPGADALEDRLRSEGIDVRRAADAAGFARMAAGAAAVVLDGYDFGAEDQRAMKAAGFVTLALDDNGHAGSYFADFVLNQNLHAQESFYQRREPYTRLLLGSRYVLLRREFRQMAGFRREIRPVAQRVLVTLGGSDPDDCTSIVVAALSRIPGLEVVVVVGGANPRHPTGPNLRVERNVRDMTPLMAWADLAVASAGTTWAELAFMGLPAVLGILADNQESGAAAIARMGVARVVGWYNRLTPDALAAEIDLLRADGAARERCSKTGQGLVDGSGAAEVARLLWMAREAQRARA